MTQRPSDNKIRLLLADTLIAAVLFSATLHVGREYLRDLNHGKSSIVAIELIYGPAVMLAAGRGFVVPNIHAMPELRAFLNGETESFDAGTLPTVIPEMNSPSAFFHRYLLYATAWFWQFHGMSWTSLELFVALLFGWSTAVLYAIMRLGMGRAFSALLTLAVMLSPSMLVMLPSLRDFSKTPFILTVFLLLGCLLKYRPRLKILYMTAAALGLVIGIGMGFRQDLLVFMPLGFLLLSLQLLRNTAPLWRRIGVLIVYLACFYSTGNPMMGNMHGATQPYSSIAQGFSMKHMDNMNIIPAAYEHLESAQDNYLFSVLYQYYRRVNHAPEKHFDYNSPDAEQAGRQWLLDMGRFFPADLAARGLAAVLRTLRCADGYTPVWFAPTRSWHNAMHNIQRAAADTLHYAGPLLAAVLLCLISARSPVQAALLLLTGMYLCGYTSLQCQFRHTFHLLFVPYWILGTLLWQVWRELKHASRDRFRDICRPHIFRIARTHARRMMLFATVVALVVCTPLWLLRIYQHHVVSQLLAPLNQLPRTEVVFSTEQHAGWTLYRVKNSVVPKMTLKTSASIASPGNQLQPKFQDVHNLCNALYLLTEAVKYAPWHNRVRYLVAEFDAASPPDWMLLAHDTQGAWNDFSFMLRLSPPPKSQGSVYYYFPVYELLMPDYRGIARNHFIGLALPNEYAASLKSLREITNVDSLRFLFHVFVPENGVISNTFQRIGHRHNPLLYYRAELYPREIDTVMAEAARKLNRPREAALLYRAALLLAARPGKELSSEDCLYIAQRLLELDALQDASETCRLLADRNDDHLVPALRLLSDIAIAWLKQSQPSNAAALFNHAANSNVHAVLPVLTEKQAIMAELGHVEILLNAYLRLVRNTPESRECFDALEAFLQQYFSTEQYLDALSQLAAQLPHACEPWLRLGAAHEREGNVSPACTAFAQAHASCPDNPEATIRHLACTVESMAPQALLQETQGVLDRFPEYRPLTERVFTYAAKRLQDKGNLAAACCALAISTVYAQDNAQAAGRLESVLLGMDKQETLIDALDNLIALNMPGLAESLLVKWCLARMHKGDFAALPRHYLGTCPDWTAFRQLVADSDFEQGAYETAAPLYQLLTANDVAPTDLRVREQVASLAAGILSSDNLELNEIVAGLPELAKTALQQLAAAAMKLHQNGQFDNAVSCMLAAVRLSTDQEWLLGALLQLGSRLEDSQAYETAIKLYLGALRHGMAEPAIADRLDRQYARLQDREQRLDAWRSLSSQAPDMQLFKRHVLKTYIEQGNLDQAVQEFQQIRDAEQETARAGIELATALLVAEQVDEGVSLMNDIVNAAPSLALDAALALQQTGNSLREKKQYDAAASVYRGAVQYAPDDQLLQWHLGDALLRCEKREEAIAAFRQALTPDPDAPGAIAATQVLRELLSSDERYDLFSQLAAKFPEKRTPLLEQIGVLIDLDRFQEAEQSLAGFGNRFERCGRVQALQGLLLCRSGDIDAGLVVLDAVARVAALPDESIASRLAELAQSLMDAGHGANAERACRMALTFSPDNVLYYRQLGEICLAKSDWESARIVFRNILLRAPESPRTAQLLHQALANLHNPALAVNTWRDIIRAHPDALAPRPYLEGARLDLKQGE